MEDKQMKKLGNYVVNTTFTRENMDNPAYAELASMAVAKTSCYYKHAQFNLNNVYDNNAVMGLQVYRDYGLHVALVYPDNSGEYSSIGIADIYNNKVEYNYCYTDGHIELNNFLNNILTDKTVIEDYDKQQIEEAIALGDTLMLDSILGDRDLTEFV